MHNIDWVWYSRQYWFGTIYFSNDVIHAVEEWESGFQLQIYRQVVISLRYTATRNWWKTAKLKTKTNSAHADIMQNKQCMCFVQGCAQIAAAGIKQAADVQAGADCWPENKSYI